MYLDLIELVEIINIFKKDSSQQLTTSADLAKRIIDAEKHKILAKYKPTWPMETD